MALRVSTFHVTRGRLSRGLRFNALNGPSRFDRTGSCTDIDTTLKFQCPEWPFAFRRVVNPKDMRKLEEVSMP